MQLKSLQDPPSSDKEVSISKKEVVELEKLVTQLKTLGLPSTDAASSIARSRSSVPTGDAKACAICCTRASDGEMSCNPAFASSAVAATISETAAATASASKPLNA